MALSVKNMLGGSGGKIEESKLVNALATEEIKKNSFVEITGVNTTTSVTEDKNYLIYSGSSSYSPDYMSYSKELSNGDIATVHIVYSRSYYSGYLFKPSIAIYSKNSNGEVYVKAFHNIPSFCSSVTGTNMQYFTFNYMDIFIDEVDNDNVVIMFLCPVSSSTYAQYTVPMIYKYNHTTDIMSDCVVAWSSTVYAGVNYSKLYVLKKCGNGNWIMGFSSTTDSVGTVLFTYNTTTNSVTNVCLNCVERRSCNISYYNNQFCKITSTKWLIYNTDVQTSTYMAFLTIDDDGNISISTPVLSNTKLQAVLSSSSYYLYGLKLIPYTNTKGVALALIHYSGSYWANMFTYSYDGNDITFNDSSAVSPDASIASLHDCNCIKLNDIIAVLASYYYDTLPTSSVNSVHPRVTQVKYNESGNTVSISSNDIYASASYASAGLRKIGGNLITTYLTYSGETNGGVVLCPVFIEHSTIIDSYNYASGVQFGNSVQPPKFTKVANLDLKEIGNYKAIGTISYVNSLRVSYFDFNRLYAESKEGISGIYKQYHYAYPNINGSFTMGDDIVVPSITRENVEGSTLQKYYPSYILIKCTITVKNATSQVDGISKDKISKNANGKIFMKEGAK